ncbi:hypothetical protein PGIGA_G00160730, partial [Pangasianodon gigas]|nr:hypothetical protein [Pangasianodon gigas]
MEEMLLRVCVVVVSLLYMKDNTVFQEQEEKVIMDMQEREYLLQKEAEKLEQEVHQVTTGLPHSNQEVSQSHRRLTNGEGEDSDVQHMLANGKVEYGVIVDEKFPSEKGEVPEIVRASQNEIKNVQDDDMSGHKKEVPQNDQKVKILNEDQIKEVQDKSPLNG